MTIAIIELYVCEADNNHTAAYLRKKYVYPQKYCVYY